MQTSADVTSETIVCQNHPKSSDSVSGVACFGAELPTFGHIMKNYRKADKGIRELKCHPFARWKSRNGSQCCCKAQTAWQAGCEEGKLA